MRAQRTLNLAMITEKGRLFRMRHRTMRQTRRTRALRRLGAWIATSICVSLSGAAADPAQTPSPIPDMASGESAQTLADTPRKAFEAFLNATRRNDYKAAAEYLDLRGISEDGAQLARELRVVLVRTLSISPASLSDAPDGVVEDGLSPSHERLGWIETPDGQIELLLSRVQGEEGQRVWKFAGATVAQIPMLYQTFGYGALERWLPRFFFDFQVLEIALWQWFALLALAMVSVLLAWLGTAVIGLLIRRYARRESTPLDPELIARASAPTRLLVASLIFRVGVTPLRLGVAAEALIGAAVRALVIIAFAWFLARLMDALANRIQNQLGLRGQDQAVGLVAPARRVLKMILIVIATVALLDSLGFSITAIVASLGVGGIAVALAAQKTIENLFGGVTLYADQPIRVGDFCRFGTTVGTVETIGLRSTRIRTLDRTLISVPNADFSNFQIENFAARDKMRLFTIVQVGYDTSPDQMRYLLVELRKMLYAHPRTLLDPCRVRFVNLGAYSLDLEIFVFVDTNDWNEFLGIREDIFLRVLDIVAESGTYFAYPSQTLYVGEDPGRDTQRTQSAERAVEAMRTAAELPLPDFSPEQIDAVDDSLEFPTVGSVRARDGNDDPAR